MSTFPPFIDTFDAIKLVAHQPFDQLSVNHASQVE